MQKGSMLWVAGESQANDADQYLNFYILMDGPNPQTTPEAKNLWGMADGFDLIIYTDFI